MICTLKIWCLNFYQVQVCLLWVFNVILLIIFKVKTAVRRVFCSYLTLLVNSKNDMALALTLDVPSRCLGRQAFTDIKHAAHKSNTSLFLVSNTQHPRGSFTCFIAVKQQYESYFLIFLLAGRDIFCKGPTAWREKLRANRIWPTPETCQRPVWLCPLFRQPGGNIGGDYRPKVNSTA